MIKFKKFPVLNKKNVSNEILDAPLEEEMDYGDEVIEEEIELDIPESVINDINLAIQNLVQEVTEDIVDKISEIVVISGFVALSAFL